MRDVVRLLVDVALIVDEMAGRIRHLAVPMVAFLLMYGLLLIGWSASYAYIAMERFWNGASRRGD